VCAETWILQGSYLLLKLRETEGEADNNCARKANRLEGKRKRKRLRASDIPIASCRE
jgi:hypothetical protein